MHIDVAGPVHGPHAIPPAHLNRVRGGGESSVGLSLPVDEVHLSPEARMIQQIGQMPDIRADRVAAAQAAIAQGLYDEPEALSVALDRLLDELV